MECRSVSEASRCSSGSLVQSLLGDQEVEAHLVVANRAAIGGVPAQQRPGKRRTSPRELTDRRWSCSELRL
ncbi:hypothetical protein DL93DRAFT_2081217 [Clavulina sp. PMI_390]|nr:hypothetical protein DL93DRAFT_2081217 [Clavulina sp. PMI_390]